MQLRTDEKDGVSICYVDGEINMNTAPQLKKEFEKVVAGKRKKVIISFDKVPYIDSSGLATVVEVFKKLRAYGGILKLVSLSPKVKNLFEITKLEKIFDILESEEEAIRSFT